MTVFLCGFMGCGKSTIGKILAKLLGLSYIDSDEYIVKNEGMTIPEIFSSKGEDYFRAVEADTIKNLCKEDAVIACGGGAMLNPETAAYAAENGTVIFIDVPFDVCYNRIKNDENRPIVVSSTQDMLEQRYNARYPIYSKHSTIRLECTDSPIKCAEMIKNLLS